MTFPSKTIWRSLSICAAALASLAACSHGPMDADRVTAMWRNVTIEVEGTLVSQGKCGILVDPEGRRYGVVGDLDKIERGERLRISGPVSYWSACGTYSAIRADRVERAL